MTHIPNSHNHEKLSDIDFKEVTKHLQMLVDAYKHRRERENGLYPLSNFHKASERAHVYFNVNVCIGVSDLNDMALGVTDAVGFFNISSDILQDMDPSKTLTFKTPSEFMDFAKRYHDEEMRYETSSDSNP